MQSCVSLGVFRGIHCQTFCTFAAAYTGLKVDIDRIRQDNAVRADVERKAGLIIWSGREPGVAFCFAMTCLASGGIYKHSARRTASVPASYMTP